MNNEFILFFGELFLLQFKIGYIQFITSKICICILLQIKYRVFEYTCWVWNDFGPHHCTFCLERSHRYLTSQGECLCKTSYLMIKQMIQQLRYHYSNSIEKIHAYNSLKVGNQLIDQLLNLNAYVHPQTI
ncbi:unnamed protein product (macronuclear) [Paramecium tetraurelia]|uniref:Uncharacterized protein n=1 Tax=Paramecium tetraurelia TaxID=5888 RepID=A0C670_PARTE|nr:uncharacterized protein GSPATT00035416001 [Paramecium tetraurelia]CAK66287.1 unnamed protein product [Paramecium tetraurelia]|eukprot:XP_001433684.1 hypothetical protein (macronuclear) [Paramecium tetraurelia strain d4-2]